MKKQNINIGDIFGCYKITGFPFFENNQKTKRKIEVTCKCGHKINAYVCNLKKLTQCKKCRGLEKRKFQIGNKINNFEIIGYENLKIKVQCKCKNIYFMKTSEIQKTKICKKCHQKKIGNIHGSYQGTKNISKTEFSNILNNAKRRNLKFNLTIDFLENLIIQQNFKCIYSGLDIYVGNTKIKKTASLDRIDSSKGYIKGNVQWVHKDVNKLKTNFTEDKFLNIIKLIFNYKIKELS